jgi:hypothetical protein
LHQKVEVDEQTLVVRYGWDRNNLEATERVRQLEPVEEHTEEQKELDEHQGREQTSPLEAASVERPAWAGWAIGDVELVAEHIDLDTAAWVAAGTEA